MLVKARGETSCRIRFLPNNSALLSSNFPTFIFWCFSGVQNVPNTTIYGIYRSTFGYSAMINLNKKREQCNRSITGELAAY